MKRALITTLFVLCLACSAQAAAAWQASGTLLGSTGADISPVWPTHTTNDIGIVLAASRVTTETCATPSGYTLLHGPTDTTAWRTYVFWKRAASGAEGNVLLDWSAATGEKYGQVHTVRGALIASSPFAASNLVADLTDPIAVASGISTAVVSQLVIVVCIASDNLSTTVTVTGTDPAAYTLNNYQDIATGADAEGHFASATRATAGAIGTVTNDFDAAMPAGAVLVAAITEEPPGSGMGRRMIRM